MNIELSSSQKTFIKNTFSPMWNHGEICFFSKKYSCVNLNEAINSLVKTFESLRLCSDGKESTFLDAYHYCDYPFYNFSNKEDLYLFAKEFINKPFNKNEPLSRFAVFEVCEVRGIILCAHHLSVDGFSGVLAVDYINSYLKGFPIYNIRRQQYEEYIKNEKTYKISKRYLRDKKFWSQQFSYNPQCLMFEEKKNSFDYASAEVDFRICPELFNSIKLFCDDNSISVQSYFNTLISIYIYRTFAMDCFVIGVPVLNRTTEIEFNSGGLYMHILPMLVNVSDKTFLQTALDIEDAQLNLFRHQKFTQYDIKELLKEEGKPHNNLFDIATDYQEFEENEDYEFEFIYSNYLSVPLEIHMQSFRAEKHNLKIRYRTSMFSEKEIQTMMNSIIAMAEDAVENPDKKISELEMLSPDEKQKVLYEFNNTHREYRKDKCIHELFEEQAEKTPEKVAVVASDKKLTYRELNEEANRIAHSLMEKGVGRGDIVGLMLPRKSSFLSALFGVLKTGAAYLPIDCDFPLDRVEHILSDSNAKLCVSEENICSLLENQDSENVKIKSNCEDICYCIYTSGSTGNPKGTLIYHRNLVWYISVLKSIYGTENINMPFFTSQSVDLTIPSFCLPLLTGGTTYLYNGELKDDLVDIFNNDELTVMKFTPTHMNIICNLVPDKLRPNIRCIIVGGETLYKEACYEFLYKFGNHIEIHNEYGPTETTVSCTDYIFNLDAKESSQYIPIGRPVANTQIYILDKYMKPVPLGVTGEVCIAGDGVGAGYLNNSELTEEKFIDNPFGEGRLYRTGDLAWWREDGNIIFVGRKDFQVKVRGLRIELGEIENTVQAVKGIERAAVVVRTDSQDCQYICAFYTGEEKSVKELRMEIGRSLPKYMVPHIFMCLPEMPLTSSGKINRNALPEIDFGNIGTEAEYKAPETAEEKALAEALCSVLSINSVNMLENFFNIGGDSIRAIYIVSELADMGYELRAADIMQSDTLSDTAKAIKATYDKAVYDQNEVNGLIPFSPVMRAFLKKCNTIPEDYVHTCVFDAECDECTARKVIDALVSHHDILRGVFCDNGIKIVPSDEREVYSFEAVTIDDVDKAKECLNQVKISKDKLVNVVFCSTATENLISMTVHHFLIDLVSWEVLIKDFQAVVKQIKNNEPISLPAKTASFMMWSEELQKYSETISDEKKEYWKNVNEKLYNAKPVNFNVYEENEAEEYSFTFDDVVSNKLINETNAAYGTRTNEVLLTALGLAVGEITGGSAGIIVESHGRAELKKHIAVERTVGWFTSCYPVIIDNNNAVEALINTKETLRRIPENGIDYLLLNEGFHENIDVKFNFYKSGAEDAGENKFVAFNYETSVFPGMINVNCFIVKNILSVSISVPKYKHLEKISEKLGAEFIKQVRKIVDVCTESDTVIKTRSDFSDDELTDAELEELKDLFDWTDVDEE